MPTKLSKPVLLFLEKQNVKIFGSFYFQQNMTVTVDCNIYVLYFIELR